MAAAQTEAQSRTSVGHHFSDCKRSFAIFSLSSSRLFFFLLSIGVLSHSLTNGDSVHAAHSICKMTLISVHNSPSASPPRFDRKWFGTQCCWQPTKSTIASFDDALLGKWCGHSSFLLFHLPVDLVSRFSSGDVRWLVLVAPRSLRWRGDTHRQTNRGKIVARNSESVQSDRLFAFVCSWTLRLPRHPLLRSHAHSSSFSFQLCRLVATFDSLSAVVSTQTPKCLTCTRQTIRLLNSFLFFLSFPFRRSSFLLLFQSLIAGSDPIQIKWANQTGRAKKKSIPNVRSKCSNKKEKKASEEKRRDKKASIPLWGLHSS